MEIHELKNNIAKLKRQYYREGGKGIRNEISYLQRQLKELRITEAIKEAFIIEVGLIPVEAGHSFPLALDSVIRTEDRTWYGRLTYSGRHKKQSFVEDF